jgi:hypothetical protein
VGQTPGCRLDEPEEEEPQKVAASAHQEPAGADAAGCRGSTAAGASNATTAAGRRRVGTDHAATCRGFAAAGASNAAAGRRHIGPDHAATCRGTNDAASRRAANGEIDAARAKHAAAGRAAHDWDADGVAAAAAVASAIAAAPGYVALGAAPRSA